MKILAISNLYPPTVLGGYELSAAQFVDELRSRGHDVHVLTSPAETAVPSDRRVRRTLALKAYQVPWPEQPHAKAIIDHEGSVSQRDNTLQVIDAVAELDPQVVLLFNLIGLGAVAIVDALDELGTPWLWDLGDRVPNSVSEAVPDEILDVYGGRQAIFAHGRFSAVSHRLLDEVVGGGIDIVDRTVVIGRGVRDYAVARSRPYLDGGTAEFIGASSLSAFKGIPIIIEALRLLRAGGVENCRVRYFGQGDAGPFIGQAEEAGVADLIEFPGFVEQEALLHIESGADAFLFPTWEREPGAAAPIEAAGSGCIPILTASSGPAERLIHEVDCLKITRDPESLASAMRRVCTGELDLPAMGAAGMAAARTALSFERCVDRLEAELRSVAEGGGEFRSARGAADTARVAIERDRQATILLHGLLERLPA